MLDYVGSVFANFEQQFANLSPDEQLRQCSQYPATAKRLVPEYCERVRDVQETNETQYNALKLIHAEKYAAEVGRRRDEKMQMKVTSKILAASSKTGAIDPLEDAHIRASEFGGSGQRVVHQFTVHQSTTISIPAVVGEEPTDEAKLWVGNLLEGFGGVKGDPFASGVAPRPGGNETEATAGAGQDQAVM